MLVQPGGKVVDTGISRVTPEKKGGWVDDALITECAKLVGAPTPLPVKAAGGQATTRPSVELTPEAKVALDGLRPYYVDANGVQIPDAQIAHAAFTVMGAIFSDGAAVDALFAIMDNQAGGVEDAVVTALKAMASVYQQ